MYIINVLVVEVTVDEKMQSHVRIRLTYNIYDYWVSAAEVLNEMKKNKESLIFKLNFGKIYNCVN